MCDLQGPVAVKHCKVVDDPIADLLDVDEAKVPTIDYLGAPPASIPSSMRGVKVYLEAEVTTFSVSSEDG